MLLGRRIRIWVVATATAFVSAVAAAPQSSAEPLDPHGVPDLPPGLSAATVAHNEASEKIADQVRAVANGVGLASIVLNSTKSRLDVYWKGPPSALRRLDGTTVDGIEVHVHPAPYSKDELSKTADKLLDLARSGSIPRISTISLDTAGKGLTVETSADTQNRFGSARLVDIYGKVTGVPTVVKINDAPQPTTRQNDSDPWFGGGLIRDPGFNPPNDLDPYSFCSVAFAAVTTSNYGRLLSARHCDPSGNVAWDDGAGDPLTRGGSSVNVRAVDDTMLIDPIGGTGPYVHGGPWNATSSNSRYHLKVGGSARAVVGQSVCTSGANSGEHCSLIVEDDVVFDCAGVNCHGFRATRDAIGTVATVGGDSGGPVYQQKSDGRVSARGVIYGGLDDVSCGNVRFPVGNCFGIVYFNDITGIERAWNVKVETTS
jgi:hypothetical protein